MTYVCAICNYRWTDAQAPGGHCPNCAGRGQRKPDRPVRPKPTPDNQSRTPWRKKKK